MNSPLRLVLAALTLLVGVAVAAAADVALYAVDDSCPQWEDEGTMAAPGSPYALVMCGPGSDPPLVWAVYGGAALAALLLAWVVLRGRRPVGRTLAWLSLGLVLPTLVVGLLHVTLPQDCLSGRTERGDCTRDREA